MFRKRLDLVDFGQLRASLGEPELVFAVVAGRVWIGVFACVLTWAVGFAMAHQFMGADQGSSAIAMGAMLTLFAGPMIWWLIGGIGFEIWVYGEAILFIQKQRGALLPWHRVSKVQQRSDSAVILFRDDGFAAGYYPELIRGGARLTQLIRTEKDKRAIPWVK